MGEIHGGGRGAVEVCGGGRRRSDGERRRRWIQGVHGRETRRQGGSNMIKYSDISGPLRKAVSALSAFYHPGDHARTSR
jgi:hypothetical protein